MKERASWRARPPSSRHKRQHRQGSVSDQEEPDASMLCIAFVGGLKRAGAGLRVARGMGPASPDRMV
jgi:hypothetical protein